MQTKLHNFLKTAIFIHDGNRVTIHDETIEAIVDCICATLLSDELNHITFERKLNDLELAYTEWYSNICYTNHYELDTSNLKPHP